MSATDTGCDVVNSQASSVIVILNIIGEGGPLARAGILGVRNGFYLNGI